MIATPIKFLNEIEKKIRESSEYKKGVVELYTRFNNFYSHQTSKDNSVRKAFQDDIERIESEFPFDSKLFSDQNYIKRLIQNRILYLLDMLNIRSVLIKIYDISWELLSDSTVTSNLSQVSLLESDGDKMLFGYYTILQTSDHGFRPILQ